MYMTQREVFPQAQSLCFAVQARQAQYSHQIHLRWFTSRTKRATIQRRICVCDTVFRPYRHPSGQSNGPGGPTFPALGPNEEV